MLMWRCEFAGNSTCELPAYAQKVSLQSAIRLPIRRVVALPERSGKAKLQLEMWRETHFAQGPRNYACSCA